MSDWTNANILAIEASSSTLRLALAFGGDRLVQSAIDTEQSLGQMIIRRIDALLQSSGLTVSQLDAIVVGIGPGSFTGLRIALAAAKGMAVATSIPVVGVSIFETAAFNLRNESGEIEVCTSVRKGELLVATVNGGRVDLTKVHPISIPDFAQQDSTSPFALVNCDGLVGLGSGRKNVSSNLDLSASILLSLGRDKLVRDSIPELANLEPLYIQPSQAEINHDRRSR